MARIRTIKPEFFQDDALAELPVLCRILFPALWCLADKEGRLEDRPKRIKVAALPYDECDADDLLARLHNAGFIQRYTVDGNDYIQVVNFVKHQRITGSEAESKSVIPASPENNPSNTEETPRKQQGNTEETPRTTGRKEGREGKGKEGKEVPKSQAAAKTENQPSSQSDPNFANATSGEKSKPKRRGTYQPADEPKPEFGKHRGGFPDVPDRPLVIPEKRNGKPSSVAAIASRMTAVMVEPEREAELKRQQIAAVRAGNNLEAERISRELTAMRGTP